MLTAIMRVLATAALLWTAIALYPHPVAAQRRPEVWFIPAPESSDLAELFALPDSWAKTRPLISVFGFGPAQVQPPQAGRGTLLPALRSVDAFATLRKWGIGVSLEVPAVKEWDCTGVAAADTTVQLIMSAQASGAYVNFISMDEPLISALGINTPKCHLDVTGAAAKTVEYVHRVTSDPRVMKQGGPPQVVDIEAYPAVGLHEIEAWISQLQQSQLKLAALHLDIDTHYVDTHPESKARLSSDLRELKSFLARSSVAFGIIIWSGYDPSDSDQDYVSRSMDLVRVVHEAIGSPDQVIFESWVKRRCADQSRDESCGRVSVPINLPESGEHVFTHTALIREAVATLSAR